jgi:hypothetical protein
MQVKNSQISYHLFASFDAKNIPSKVILLKLKIDGISFFGLV